MFVQNFEEGLFVRHVNPQAQIMGLPMRKNTRRRKRTFPLGGNPTYNQILD
jgi:hypothetical protein